MFHLLLLVVHLCIGGTLSQTVVRGVVGQAITLPCTYSIQGGTNHMCWGKGSCPNSKCNNEILQTDGIKVISRTSHRYQLGGWIVIGDVSLTIVNLKEEDKGMYCCRIEVPGWFNDLKKTLTLQVDRATTTTSRTTTTTTAVAPRITVTPPTTAFLLSNPPSLAVPTVTPLTTNVPPMTTSSVNEAIEFSASDPPFTNISPSTAGLQTTYGYNYDFLTTESEIATSTPVPAVALPFTNVSSMTTSSSTSVAPRTASRPLLKTKSPSTNPQHEYTENSHSLTLEAAASSTGLKKSGLARILKMFLHDPVAISCAVLVLVLLLLLLVLMVKKKNMRLYQLNRAKSGRKLEEPEKMLLGTEGENGIFAL